MRSPTSGPRSGRSWCASLRRSGGHTGSTEAEDTAPKGTVVARAFRGSRRSSVYREHVVTAAAFVRIAATAARLGLGALALGELDKSQARQLADDLGSLRASLELPELDADLTALGDVARWCSRASGEAWLRIEES